MFAGPPAETTARTETGFFSTGRISRFSAERPWKTLFAWALLVVASVFFITTMLDDGLTTELKFTNTPESQRGVDLIEELHGYPTSTTEVIIVSSRSHTVDDREFRTFAEGLYAEVAALGPDVIREGTFQSYYLTGAPSFVSEDRHTTIMPLTMAGDYDDASVNVHELVDLVKETNGEGGFEVLVTGGATVSADFEEIGLEGLERGEMFGIPVALIILGLVLGAVVIAFVPLIVAIVSIAVALGSAALIGQAFSLSFFITNIIFMVGLAVGIDYALFIVARYREELQHGRSVLDAIERAGDTASRAVMFSGMTVVIGLAGMLLVPFNSFIAIATGAILVVTASVLAALTLLPAILRLLGSKVDALSVPAFRSRRPKAGIAGGGWDRISHGVMRYPVLSVIIGGGIMIALAVPALNMKTGTSGVSTLPDEYQSKRGFEILDESFSAGDANPAQIVIYGDIVSDRVQAAIDDLKGLMASDSEGAFGQPRELEVSGDGKIALLEVSLAGDATEKPAEDAVRRLRELYVPDAFANGSVAEVSVTGVTAYNLDVFKTDRNAFRTVLPFVLGMSFILLMTVFRSIIVPLKAIILNLLSVGAAYGLMVLMFQEGLGERLGIFIKTDVIESGLLLFLFTILFGLSMDYHVFLLSRIRERFDATGDNAESVAFGIRTTGRLITGAALIMVAVFWGFAAGDLVALQQMGFGMGSAILLDATIIRMVLVPASMKLLGGWNWYLPKWMDWLPDLRVEGGGTRRPVSGQVADVAAAGD